MLTADFLFILEAAKSRSPSVYESEGKRKTRIISMRAYFPAGSISSTELPSGFPSHVVKRFALMWTSTVVERDVVIDHHSILSPDHCASTFLMSGQNPDRIGHNSKPRRLAPLDKIADKI